MWCCSAAAILPYVKLFGNKQRTFLLLSACTRRSKTLTLSYLQGGCRIVPSVARGLNDDACQSGALSNESSYRRCTRRILKEDRVDNVPFHASQLFTLTPISSLALRPSSRYPVYHSIKTTARRIAFVVL
jgi:hypothetical protein